MDNLTHALVGAALAKTGLGRTTPLATPTLILAANAPDVDVLAYLEGPYYALAVRRGVTHGIPAMILLPFAVTGVMLAWDRWRGRRGERDAARAGPLLLLSVLGLLTHPTLDWMNTYGMRWGLPFDGRWAYGDSLFIIDPWLWLLLGGAVLLSGRWGPRGLAAWAAAALATSGLVLGAPVPAPSKVIWALALAGLATCALGLHRSPARPAPARLLGSLALVYVAAMVAADARARREVGAALDAAGVGPVEALMVAPRPGDPLGAEVVVRTPAGYLRGTHRWNRSPRVQLDPGAATAHRAGAADVDEAEVGAAIAAAITQPDAHHYLVWSRFPYFRVASAPSGWRVLISDARYDGRGTGSLGGVEIEVPGAALGRPPPPP